MLIKANRIGRPRINNDSEGSCRTVFDPKGIAGVSRLPVPFCGSFVMRVPQKSIFDACLMHRTTIPPASYIGMTTERWGWNESFCSQLAHNIFEYSTLLNITQI